MPKTKVNVLVTVEVDHETNVPIEFINNVALDAVSKKSVAVSHHYAGFYRATATTKEIVDLNALQKTAVNKYVSASLRVSDSYY